MGTFFWMNILRWCAVRMSVTPLETCLLYGMFGSGLIPMGYARYVSLVLVTFWSILTHMFYDIMKINASWWHPGLLLYPLPPRFQSPAWGGPSEQTDPEYRFSHYTIIEQTDPEYRLSHYTIMGNLYSGSVCSRGPPHAGSWKRGGSGYTRSPGWSWCMIIHYGIKHMSQDWPEGDQNETDIAGVSHRNQPWTKHAI